MNSHSNDVFKGDWLNLMPILVYGFVVLGVPISTNKFPSRCCGTSSPGCLAGSPVAPEPGGTGLQVGRPNGCALLLKVLIFVALKANGRNKWQLANLGPPVLAWIR